MFLKNAIRIFFDQTRFSRIQLNFVIDNAFTKKIDILVFVKNIKIFFKFVSGKLKFLKTTSLLSQQFIETFFFL